MIISAANRWQKKLKDTTGIERQEIILDAELMDRTALVKWFKNGQEIKSGENIQIVSAEGKHQLIFKQATLEDTGDYSIETKGLKCACSLTVQEAEKAPIIKPEKLDYAFDQGKPFTFEIPYIVTGTRTSDVICKLECNGNVIQTKDVDQVVKENVVVLSFRKPARASTGPYTITLSNSQGQDSKTLNINVMDVPAPPEGPLAVTDIFKDRCKLSWKPPKDDGGCPISHYVIERQDLSAKGGWTEVLSSDTTTVNVTDLTQKKEYKFRVRAVNKKGKSEPLVADKTTLAKDPFDAPSKPGLVELTDWDSDRVDLKWDPPSSDGGAPIEEYIIEVKDKFSNAWTEGARVSGSETKGRVKDLKEGVQYEFRIRAVNKAGPGEPSDPTKPIIAKARFVKPYIIGDGIKGLIVKIGTTIKLDIDFGGEPMPTVMWTLNGQEIKEVTGKTTITTVEDKKKNTLLVTKDSVRADSGTYELTLTNSSGTVTSKGDIVVLGKPTKPRGPLVSPFR